MHLFIMSYMITTPYATPLPPYLRYPYQRKWNFWRYNTNQIVAIGDYVHRGNISLLVGASMPASLGVVGGTIETSAGFTSSFVAGGSSAIHVGRSKSGVGGATNINWR